LETVRVGNDRMAESLREVDHDAAKIGSMLSHLSQDMAFDVQLGPQLHHAAEALNLAVKFAPELGEDDAVSADEPVAPEAQAQASELFARIAALYTMASEREVHLAYLASIGLDVVGSTSATDADDGLFGDNGLFGDDDFDDGLF
jgi:hypothetical protein